MFSRIVQKVVALIGSIVRALSTSAPVLVPIPIPVRANARRPRRN
jgi:hypothetical protein